MPANYVGCFLDSGNARLLPTKVSTSSSMTNTMCNKLCNTAGYTYSGTQYYSEVR